MQFVSHGHRILIRPIRPEDSQILAKIIREAMAEFNADPHTTIIGDPALDTMYDNYQDARSAYFIAEADDRIVGGCGVAPLKGGDEKICELQRMFLSKDLRGLGIGRNLLEICLNSARGFKYTHMYLETLSDMLKAIDLYTNFGFAKISGPLGNTGHTGCNVNMIRPI